MNGKKQYFIIHIFFLLALLITSDFFNCVEGETVQNTNSSSFANSINVPKTVKTKIDSEQYSDQLQALLEKLAGLYQELKTYVKQYDLIKNAIRNAEKDYSANPSSQNSARVEALKSNAQKILVRIKKLIKEIDVLENITIPNTKRMLSEEASSVPDSGEDAALVIIDSIKPEINQVAYQYPEIDELLNDKLKYKTPAHIKKHIIRKQKRTGSNPD